MLDPKRPLRAMPMLEFVSLSRFLLFPQRSSKRMEFTNKYQALEMFSYCFPFNLGRLNYVGRGRSGKKAAPLLGRFDSTLYALPLGLEQLVESFLKYGKSGKVQQVRY